MVKENQKSLKEKQKNPTQKSNQSPKNPTQNQKGGEKLNEKQGSRNNIYY